MSNEEDFISGYLSLVARAWHDRGFRERLRAYPQRVLAESGWAIPAGAAVTVTVTRTLDVLEQIAAWRDAAATGRYTFFLPLGAVQDLTDEQLESIVGGALAVLAVFPDDLRVVDEWPPARP